MDDELYEKARNNARDIYQRKPSTRPQEVAIKLNVPVAVAKRWKLEMTERK
ncbi:MAG TPA: hypothetical protein PK916_09065 [Bacteroidota bacterium]|nr:hypothetical protein [Bacteroidota bacterium]